MPSSSGPGQPVDGAQSPSAPCQPLDGALAIRDDEQSELRHLWGRWARDEQLPPAANWTTWLLMGGRGSGKTRAGAEWVRSIAMFDPPETPIALVGETILEALAVMVRGPSGLLAVHPHKDRPKLVGTTLTWPNGAEAQVFGATDADRFRGPQFGGSSRCAMASLDA